MEEVALEEVVAVEEVTAAAAEVEEEAIATAVLAAAGETQRLKFQNRGLNCIKHDP